MESGSARLASPWRKSSELDDDYYPQGGWDTVFLVTLLLLGLPANGLMGWLAGSQARHRTGKRLALFLLSLAISDFLFLVATAFQIMEIRLQGHWPLGTAACRFYYFLWGVSYASGLFLLSALSLDRCLMAFSRRWYPCHRPSRLPLWLCSGAWVLATLYSVPWLVFPEANVWWYDLVICFDFWDTEELPLRVLEILGGLLPFLLLLGSHILTQIQGCRVRRLQRRDGGAVTPLAGFSRVASTILSAYIVLRLPYQLAQLLYLAYLWDYYPGYFLWEALVYSDYLVVLNSCLSPLLCLLASANIRALLHSMLSSFAAALAEEQFRGVFPAVSLPTQAEPAVQLQPTPPTQPQENPMAQVQVNPTTHPQPNLVDQPQANPPAQSTEPPPASNSDPCEGPTSSISTEQPTPVPSEKLSIPPAPEGENPADAPKETSSTQGPP